ncbi:restriction endonuclease subunit S [Cyanobacterium sp. DS4]|uniref:restriction endonuclease subunit S n=1 Tax=Cyanobacterium sp. DS4 TaxID=2878255 RepID=UPI002E804329|nr:restriction endonuclease subunit S [Cyanobacterium sp. Dongsha4]WVL00024.1 restriction endonuclease subunit S [Cyanobacterium sp. Dongsha4]
MTRNKHNLPDGWQWVKLESALALPSAYLRSHFHSEEAKSWKQVKFKDILTSIQNGIYKTADFYGSGYPFLRMYNIQNNSWHLTMSEIAKITLTKDELNKYCLQEGDLLISRVNSHELVGKCAYIQYDLSNYVYENMLIRLRLSQSVNSLFIAQQINSFNIRKQIQSVAKRAIGQSSINSKDIGNLILLIPSLERQREIAIELNEKMRECEKLKQALQEQLETVNQLPSALLRRAFRGES